LNFKEPISQALHCVVYYEESFGGPSRLHKESSVSIKKAEQFLQTQDTNTKNKNVRHKFKRRKIIAPHSMYLWQADLIILSNIGKINRGYKYILTVIDCFSRKAAAVPLNRKTGKDVTFAFAKVFAEMGGKPKYLQCDQGKEFFNMEFKSFLTSSLLNFSNEIVRSYPSNVIILMNSRPLIQYGNFIV